MDVITDTLHLADYPAALYIGVLPSGGVATVTAAATFGDVAIIFLLVVMIGLQLAQAVRQWKH